MVANLVLGERWPGGFDQGVLPGLALLRPEYFTGLSKSNSDYGRWRNAILCHDGALVTKEEDTLGMCGNLHIDDNVDLLPVLIGEPVAWNGIGARFLGTVTVRIFFSGTVCCLILVSLAQARAWLLGPGNIPLPRSRPDGVPSPGPGPRPPSQGTRRGRHATHIPFPFAIRNRVV